jgi:hypothetical protein
VGVGCPLRPRCYNGGRTTPISGRQLGRPRSRQWAKSRREQVQQISANCSCSPPSTHAENRCNFSSSCQRDVPNPDHCNRPQGCCRRASQLHRSQIGRPSAHSATTPGGCTLCIYFDSNINYLFIDNTKLAQFWHGVHKGSSLAEPEPFSGQSVEGTVQRLMSVDWGKAAVGRRNGLMLFFFPLSWIQPSGCASKINMIATCAFTLGSFLALFPLDGPRRRTYGFCPPHRNEFCERNPLI